MVVGENELTTTATMRARDNPFRSERIERLGYRLDGTTWTELLERCKCLDYHCAVVGPFGSGKTTLLEELETRLLSVGFHTRLLRLKASHPCFIPGKLNRLTSALSRGHILLFDSAGQLNYAMWLWLRWRSRNATGLIITSHKPGLLPTLWECGTSDALLADLMAQLLGCRAGEVRKLARTLHQKHDGNLREALRECYDAVAQQGEISGASNLGFCTDTRCGASIVHA